MIDMEGTHDEDEPTRWTSIGWQAALITNRLRNSAQLTEQNPIENDENTGKKRDPGDGPKDRVPDNAADIERRVADILAMENRLKRKRI
jgi:hypothetical protein